MATPPPTPNPSIAYEQCGGGVNNKVYLAHPVSGDSLVIRIYNNGFNRPRVEYEHAVLLSISNAVASRGKPLSFKIPSLRRSLADGTSTIVRLPNGTDACCFDRIAGSGAPLSAARSIGRATAELVEAMAAVHVALPLPNPLYRNIYDGRPGDHGGGPRERGPPLCPWALPLLQRTTR